MLNQSNGSLHLDGIIGLEEEDNPILLGIVVNWFWQLRPRICIAQLLYYQERAFSGGAIYKTFQTLPFGTTFYSED